MEGYTRKEDGSPQLLDLIPREREWVAKRAADEKSHGLSGERKLELSLGPPTGDWTIVTDDKNNKASSQNAPHESLHYSFGYFQTPAALKPSLPWQQQQQQMKAPSFLHLQSVMNEPSQPCNNRVEQGAAADQKKGFSAAPANINTAVPNSQKRTAPSPVVGWPPIRSFRKNLASGNSSKLSSESPDADPGKVSGSKPAENGSSRPFVKINMDGIPIGRKIDLKAYHSYEKLSYAVDELFRDLLAAQSESCVGETKDRENGGKGIGGLLDGSGEYTLVYEDNEGDRMLVGDVPWHMFVSTVKRLRVLKSSELPKLSRGSKLAGKLCS